MSNQIFVKESDVPLTDTRKDFVRRFLRGRFESYSDERHTRLQCEKGKYRSITEIHQIVLSRFPKTSFEAILRIVRDLINEDNPVSMIWCTQVNKVVLRYYDRATRTYMTSYSRDKYLNSKGVDGYSLADYERMLQELSSEN